MPLARADLGIVVADPTNQGASRYTVAGHSLVYLSGVCVETTVRARLCNPGEQGSVVSMYPNFGETHPYAWNLVPLSIYLDGSPAPESRLLFASRFVKQSLELHARKELFQSVCANDSCPQMPHRSWRDMVATTADRDVFIYAVHTTPAQDQAVVDWLNQSINQNHYNAFTNNCANFATSLINAVFPHATHRDLLNDIGMKGPKTAARTFTQWALKHPELGFYTMHFAQQPGDILRSGIARSGTETAIYMKKYSIPIVVLGDFELPTAIVASYLTTGRFGLYKEFSRHPSPNIVTLEAKEKSAARQGDKITSAALHLSAAEEQTRIIGSPEEWAGYRNRFALIQSLPEARNLSSSHKKFFDPQYATATALVDRQGQPWLLLETAGSTRRVGISSGNLLSPSSDPEAAFQLMLGRIAYALAAKDHLRETMEEFRKDWSLLEQAQTRLQAVRTAAATPSPADVASPEPVQP